MTPFIKPDWAPKVPDGSNILVVGASGGIGNGVVQMLLDGSSCTIGAQCRDKSRLIKNDRMIVLENALESMDDCDQLVAEFVKQAGSIDGLVILSGGINVTAHWSETSEEEWLKDINSNLNIPFYLAKAVSAFMKDNGGKIILNGTESSLHGGSATSFAYGIAKHGTECMVKGLARDGASNNILVNGIRLGFIDSGFHKRWQGKTPQDLVTRAEMVPLKRAGHVDEAAALIVYLLSGYANYITGQMFALTGGDWL